MRCTSPQAGRQAMPPAQRPHSLHSNDSAHRRTLLWHQLAVSLPIPHIRLVEQLHPQSSKFLASRPTRSVAASDCQLDSLVMEPPRTSLPQVRRGTQPAAAVGATSRFALAPGSLALLSAVVSTPNTHSSPHAASHALITLRLACHNRAVPSTKKCTTCSVEGRSVSQCLPAGYDYTPAATGLLQLLSWKYLRSESIDNDGK